MTARKRSFAILVSPSTSGRAELTAVRSRARAVGDMTTVSDCNVYLRRHPEGHQ
ncbi:hypothetical protein ACIQRK_37370 [Streptomyces anulatus]